MLKIKDYLVLKDIENYLENKYSEMLEENKGFLNNPINEIKTLLNSLRSILDKLENEEWGRVWIKK